MDNSFLKRLKDYEDALKEIKVKRCFCGCMKERLTKENYPELWAHKPFYVVYREKDRCFYNYLLPGFIDNYWFKPSKTKKRIKILKSIIYNMYSELTLMKRSDSQELKEYRQALYDLHSSPERPRLYGLCFLLPRRLTKENYPELLKYKPNDVRDDGNGYFYRPISKSAYWVDSADREWRLNTLKIVITNLTH